MPDTDSQSLERPVETELVQSRRVETAGQVALLADGLQLLSFNVGVAAEQLAVVGEAFLLAWHYPRRNWYRDRIVVPDSALIACTAVY